MGASKEFSEWGPYLGNLREGKKLKGNREKLGEML